MKGGEILADQNWGNFPDKKLFKKFCRGIPLFGKFPIKLRQMSPIPLNF